MRKRDYVVRLELKESLSPDGTGSFRNEWHAVPDFTPRRHDIIRLTRDDGSWVVTPRGEGKSWAVYRFVVDPGGWVPTFAANLGNERGVKETWDAVEKEALRRSALRLASPHPDPLPRGERERAPARPDQPR